MVVVSVVVVVVLEVVEVVVGFGVVIGIRTGVVGSVTRIGFRIPTIDSGFLGLVGSVNCCVVVVCAVGVRSAWVAEGANAPPLFQSSSAPPSRNQGGMGRLVVVVNCGEHA